MDFFIGKNSTFPVLEYDVTDDSKKYGITPEMWEECAVTFSMIDEYGMYRILNKQALLIVNEKIIESTEPYKFKIGYKFSVAETSRFGQFIGEFKVDFYGDNGCGKITFPVTSKINIYISDSITKTLFI
jgi:hypothetical protein